MAQRLVIRHFQLQRREPLARSDARVNSASTRRVEQRGSVAAVNHAYGIQRMRPRSAGKHRRPLANFDELEIERLRNPRPPSRRNQRTQLLDARQSLTTESLQQIHAHASES